LRFVTFRTGKEKPRPGVLWKEKIIDLNAAAAVREKKGRAGEPEAVWPTLVDFLKEGPKGFRKAGQILSWADKEYSGGKAQDGKTRPRVFFDSSKVRILPPLPNPPKILCLARNYVSHVQEVTGSGTRPPDTLIFMKPATSLIGPEDFIVIPPFCRKLDHEVELAVVIGRRGRFIPEDAAMDHVAGYTIINDVSDREYTSQKDSHRLINWFFMKGQDTFAPLGPSLVEKDEIGDPHKLRLRLWVNGDLRQDSEGEEMIFKIPQIISRVSQFVTLEPGDILSTGTPLGTSFSTKQYLKAGDVIECEIEGIGRLRNFVKVEEAVYRKK
jgi:2-keto-4-pentenoate hydratase/2-oxohepta-3-ene-1,7-dioic acid hydratase in catechol pathway